MKLSDNLINAAIPDNIELFVNWLQKKGIKYHDFKTAGKNYKLRQFREFLIEHPEVRQYKLF